MKLDMSKGLEGRTISETQRSLRVIKGAEADKFFSVDEEGNLKDEKRAADMTVKVLLGAAMDTYEEAMEAGVEETEDPADSMRRLSECLEELKKLSEVEEAPVDKVVGVTVAAFKAGGGVRKQLRKLREAQEEQSRSDVGDAQSTDAAQPMPVRRPGNFAK